jgi:hypothetical protein
MSISKVKALRASAEAEAFAKDVKHNVVHNCLCQPAFNKVAKLPPFWSKEHLALSELIEFSADNEFLVLSMHPDIPAILTVIIDCKRNRDVLSQCV